jgi:hypothetical protein
VKIALVAKTNLAQITLINVLIIQKPLHVLTMFVEIGQETLEVARIIRVRINSSVWILVVAVINCIAQIFLYAKMGVEINMGVLMEEMTVVYV